MERFSNKQASEYVENMDVVMSCAAFLTLHSSSLWTGFHRASRVLQPPCQVHQPIDLPGICTAAARHEHVTAFFLTGARPAWPRGLLQIKPNLCRKMPALIVLIEMDFLDNTSKKKAQEEKMIMVLKKQEEDVQ